MITRLSHLWFIGVISLPIVPISVVHGFSAFTPVTKSRTVTLPLLVSHDCDKDAEATKQMLQYAFEYIVEYSKFLEHASPNRTRAGKAEHSPEDGEFGIQDHLHSSCRIPALGKDIGVDFYPVSNIDERETLADNDDSTESFVLKISGASESDCGWIFSKFYEERDTFRGKLGIDDLHHEVVKHFNNQPPSPGFPASSSAKTAEEASSQQNYLENLLDASRLQQLGKLGYVVLETNTENKRDGHSGTSFHISSKSQKDISQYLVETTGDAYRKDMVHFLTKPQAIEAGLGEHYDMLLSIATYLNNNLKFRKSENNPIAPATTEDPLTVPRMIQLAQYTEGGFYEAHSDNSLYETKDEKGRRMFAPSGVRNNFRHYTCILYCNDLEESDGGALRLYLGSRDMRNIDATKTCQFVDVIPKNGRLLIFDSCMVHSVEKLLSSTKIRRALTLWILRPNDSDVPGESYF